MAHALNHLVSLDSKPGVGSTFIVHVPFAAETSGSIDKAKQAATRKAQYGFADVHVMVIENDESIIAATTTLLDQAVPLLVPQQGGRQPQSEKHSCYCGVFAVYFRTERARCGRPLCQL